MLPGLRRPSQGGRREAWGGVSEPALRAVADDEEGVRDHDVRGDQHDSAPAARAPVEEEDAVTSTEAPRASDLDQPEGERERLDQPREQDDGGDEEDGDLGARRERDLGRELDVPAAATTTAPPCSAALPTMATITAATKNSDSPTSSANSSIDPTRISATKAVTTVAAESTPSESRNDQARIISGSSETCISRCRRSGVPGDADVDDEEHDRDRHGDDGERMPVGIAVPAGDRRDQEEDDRERRRARTR